MDDYGLGKFLAEQRLVRRAEVSAPLEWAALALQNLDGLVVGDAREGRLDGFQLGEIAAQDFEFAAALGEDALDDIGDEALGERHHVVERGEGGLRLDHPELGQVAAGLGFFRAERGAEAIDLAERRRGRFAIKLARLREVGLLVEVLRLEKRRGSFAGGGREDGRIGQGESVAVEKIAGGADDFRAHAQDGRLARRAQPEVAVLHQEIDAVFFGRDGIGIGFRRRAARLGRWRRRVRSRPGARLSARTLPSTMTLDSCVRAFDGIEDFGRDGVLRDYSLDDAGAVAKLGKRSLPLSRRL